MLPKGFFRDIVLIILSVSIFFTYLKPTFALVKSDQDLLTTYRFELTQVRNVNARLNQLVSESRSLSTSERDALYRYLPNEVDDIEVQRDILLIADEGDITIAGLSVTEGSQTQSSNDQVSGPEEQRSILVPRFFNVEFSSSYDDLKNFLGLLELNDYPLHVSQISVTGTGGGEDSSATGMMGVSITLVTYSLTMQEQVY